MKMSLTKDYFDHAKETATKRLEGWINRVKEEKQPINGIPRLQNEFSGVFKKIVWKPRLVQKFARKWKENSKDGPFRNFKAENSADDENKFVGLRGRSSIPRNLYMEDQRVYDSNSSNLSSRLEYREEIGKQPDQIFPRTPIIRTPFSQGDRAENDTETDAEEAEALDQISSKENSFLLRVPRERRGTIINYDKSLQPQFTRIRRRVVQKKEPHVAHRDSLAQAGGSNINTDDSLMVPQTTMQKSSMHILDGRPMSSHTSIKINYNVKKGVPVEILFRRTQKAVKALKAIKTSNLEIAVPTLKEQASEEKKTAILNKFRRLVRLLVHVRVLLNVARFRIEEEEKSKAFKRIDGDCELSFDSTMYKTAFSYGGLTTRIQRALKKNPADRNEEDARMLMEVMLRMPVFIKYSTTVKQWLAKQMWYDCFQNGRVIVKQGDPGSRMYFVVSGEVDLKRTDTTLTGEENSYHLKTLTAGATFGEIALIRHMRREFTAVCKGTSEFLSLSKSEFNNALRHRWEQECNTRYSFLRSCEIFSCWTDRQLQYCADASELKEYNDNKVILGDIDRLTESVYFIRKGRCDVVRRIAVFRHQSPYLRPNLYIDGTAKRRQEIAEKSYCKNRRIYQREVHFLTVTTLHPGNYFGAGENLRDTFILSRGKTECVVVNSAQFSIQGKSEQLRNLARDRDVSLPSNKSLYRRFEVNRKWYEYRNKVLKEVYRRKKMGQSSSYADVPRTIKNEPRIPDDLINYN